MYVENFILQELNVVQEITVFLLASSYVFVNIVNDNIHTIEQL